MSQPFVLQDRIKKELMDISATINEIVDSYRKLHNPLIESQKDVPRATEQLDKISEQTEAATQKMLDSIETITQREEEVIDGLSNIKQFAESGKTTDIQSAIDSLIQKATDNNNDAYMIMDTLQFQDITAQQINHAIVLLEELETKLNKILGVLEGEEVQKTYSRKERAYDPNADLFEKKTDQQDIDSLFSQKK